MPKNKLYLVLAAVILVLVLASGSWYVMSQKKAAEPVVEDQTQQVLTLSPDEIGLTVAFRADNKAMKFTIGKASDMKAIEYQIAYTKAINGEQVPEGLIGEVDMTDGSPTAGISFREFGTCSSGVCRYDTVVSPVTLTLKITKADNKVYQVTKTVSIPQ